MPKQKIELELTDIMKKLQEGTKLSIEELAGVCRHLLKNPNEIKELSKEQFEQLDQQMPGKDMKKPDIDPVDVYRRMVSSGDVVPGAYVVGQGNPWGTPQGVGLQADSVHKAKWITASTAEAGEDKHDLKESIVQKAMSQKAALQEVRKAMQAKHKPPPTDELLKKAVNAIDRREAKEKGKSVKPQMKR